MTSIADKAARLQALIARPGPYVSAHPWDVGTTKVLTSLDFEALGTASSGRAFGTGRRDAENAIPRDEMVAWAGEMAAATHLPMTADLENGFGDDPKDCALTIKRAAEAGLVGGSIEDATGRGNEVYPREAAAARIKAAAEAAKALPFPFQVIARADGLIHGHADVDEIVRRLQAYEAAGAGMLFAPGLPDLASIRKVCEAVKKPVIVLIGRGAQVTLKDLAEAGAKEVGLGSTLMRAAWGVMFAAAKEVKEHGTFTFEKGSADYRLLNDLMAHTPA
jgi:2-methylisocitrate lyase-like PEP mutase family enzyme